MCPKLAFTVKSFPKYFWNVLAFAGDSTITKFSITGLSNFTIDCKENHKLGNFPNFNA